MTRRRDLLQHMQGLEEVCKILGSMKSLAYMESRKLTHRIGNQQSVVRTIELAAADFLSFHPYPTTSEELPRVFIVNMGNRVDFVGGIPRDFEVEIPIRPFDASDLSVDSN